MLRKVLTTVLERNIFNDGFEEGKSRTRSEPGEDIFMCVLYRSDFISIQPIDALFYCRSLSFRMFGFFLILWVFWRLYFKGGGGFELIDF